MQKDITVYLIVHDYATDIRTGGGQRTHMFFEAAKKIARTEVIVLGMQPRPELAALFPGAAKVHRVRETGFPPRAPTRIGRLVASARRLGNIRRHFAPDPQVQRDIQAIVTRSDLSVVLVRYAYPYFKMGLSSDRNRSRLVMVDLDDLDDKKYETESRRRFGAIPTRLVMDPLVLAPLQRILAQGLAKTSGTWVCAAEDAQSYPGVISRIVPNVPYLPSGPAGGDRAFPRASTGQDVLFLASARHAPNQQGITWFLQTCWPALSDRFPDAELRIVGHKDWSFLRDGFGHLTRVHFGGTVADIATEYARARLAISPVTLGAGTKIKVVEAFAFGRPVVLTSHSARGFETHFSGQMAVADTAGAFVDACARFLSDPDLADRTGADLQAAQMAHFSFGAAVTRIVDDVQSAVGRAYPGRNGQST